MVLQNFFSEREIEMIIDALNLQKKKIEKYWLMNIGY